jgi:hypothetical protein
MHFKRITALKDRYFEKICEEKPGVANCYVTFRSIPAQNKVIKTYSYPGGNCCLKKERKE